MKELYSFVEKYAAEYNLKQSLSLLSYACKMHEGQYRSGAGKIPYVCHPLKMAAHAISIGFVDDDIISACLLHDVCEDCGILPEELPASDKTKEIVALLTRDFEAEMKSEENEAKYYKKILNHKEALIVKLLDRCNNVSEMSEGFTDTRLENYIRKTEKWFGPMIAQAKVLYPEYEKEIFIIEYQMMSILIAAKRSLK